MKEFLKCGHGQGTVNLRPLRDHSWGYKLIIGTSVQSLSFVALSDKTRSLSLSQTSPLNQLFLALPSDLFTGFWYFWQTFLHLFSSYHPWAAMWGQESSSDPLSLTKMSARKHAIFYFIISLITTLQLFFLHLSDWKRHYQTRPASKVLWLSSLWIPSFHVNHRQWWLNIMN